MHFFVKKETQRINYYHHDYLVLLIFFVKNQGKSALFSFILCHYIFSAIILLSEMLEFMHSSTRSSSIMPPTNAINYHHHLAQSPVYHHYPAIKPKQKDVPPTSSAHRHHNHHNRQQNQPLQQKHRAKSVPNLDAPEIPQWITDSRTGVTYTIGQLLGRGGFGKCFLAYTNRQYFAMKVISRSHIKKHGNQISKIGREVQIHSSLCHPNIVALYSTFQCSQNIYMLLEYCPNRTLSEHIDQYHGIPESNAIVFMKQLLLAVRYLHEDCFLLHRDIKPGNILLSREWTVKLADFGFCCSIDELLSRPEHTVCGTPNYVAAEVIDKQGHTIYSDCWALACTFFAMLFGRPPFHCEHLHQTYSRIRRCEYSFPPDNLMVSESAKDLIRRTLIHRPEYRLKTPEMLAHSALNPKPLFNISSSSQSIANNLSNDFNAIFQQIEDTTPSTFSRLFINSNPIPQSMIQSESNTANCGINFGKNPLFQSPTKSFSKSTPLQNFSNFLPSMDFSTFAPNLGGNVKTTQFGGFGIDSGLGGSGSADSPNAIGGPLGKAVQFTLDKYIQTLQSVIDSFNPLNLVLMEHSSISAGADVLPSSFVAKWVDYTNKFGFGVTLRDGTRTILFNDQSSLSSTDNQRYFSFLANKFNDECIEWNYSEGFPRSDICDKVTFMRVLREYMDRELYSSVPINYQRQQSNNDFLMDLISRKQSKQRISASGMQQQFPLVHLIDYRKFPNALFIFLSDGTCQVNFTDTRYKLTMTMMPNQEEPDGISYQLYLITPKQKCFHFRTVNTFEFDQPAPPLSDDGWTLLRTFQRVLKSYHQSLNRNSLIYSTYC